MILLLSAIGFTCFQASTWVSFVVAHELPSFLAYAFPFEPFLLTLAGQALAIVLSLFDRIRNKALSFFSRPVVLLVFGLVAGAGGALGLIATQHTEVQVGALITGFASTPLLFAWGVFFANQQPRLAALSMALSFVFCCLVASAAGLLDSFGVLVVIVVLPLISTVLWLLCIRRTNQLGTWYRAVRDSFSGALDPLPAAASAQAHDDDEADSLQAAPLQADPAPPRATFRESLGNSVSMLFGYNRTLLVFSVCVFTIYLMEQFVFSGDDNPPGYMLYTLCVALAMLGIFSLYSGLGKGKDPDVLWPFFILLIFGALLTIPFFWGAQSDVAANISIVASRSLTTLTWVVLVTTISRYSLEPFRAFAIGMIFVSLLPWFLAFAISMVSRQLLPEISDYAGAISLILAFVLVGSLTLQFTLFYMQSQRSPAGPIQGRKGLLPLSSERHGADPDEVTGNEAASSALPKSADRPSPDEAELYNAQRFDRCLAAIKQDYHLTSREADVIGLMIQGRTLPEIAEKFVLSVNTVRTHYGHAYQKLGIHKKREMLDLFERYRQGSLR